MAERDQSFESFTEWVNKAPSWLRRHPLWSESFKAICYDTQGRLCFCGADFKRAEREGTYPIRWLWPDQVAELAARTGTERDSVVGSVIAGGDDAPTD